MTVPGRKHLACSCNSSILFTQIEQSIDLNEELTHVIGPSVSHTFEPRVMR